MFKLNLRSMCLILCMFFLTLAVALIYADTGTAAATPWWAELLTAAVPALLPASPCPMSITGRVWSFWRRGCRICCIT